MGNGDFISEHEKYLPIVKASQRYKEKMSLGAWGKTCCLNCQKWVGMPFWSMASVLPTIFLLLLGMSLSSLIVVLTSPILGLIVMFYIIDWIPLHPLKGK